LVVVWVVTVADAAAAAAAAERVLSTAIALVTAHEASIGGGCCLTAVRVFTNPVKNVIFNQIIFCLRLTTK
jgi:hypothetical protein